MMKQKGQNYRAWQIETKDFKKLTSVQDRLSFLVKFAVLAPSSHNSQPWRFFIKENTLFCRADQSRLLPESDANNRQAYISIGAALENIVLAAEGLGSPVRVDLFPDKQTVAAISFGDDQSYSSNKKLFHFITRRRTNRNQYSERPISDFFVNSLYGYSDDDVRVHIVRSNTQKESIANIVLSAIGAAMDSVSFRRELSQFVIHNKSASPIGMPGATIGIPTIPSYIAPHLLRFFNMDKLKRKEDELLLKKYTTAYLILTTQSDNPETWVKVGQRYQRILLVCTMNDIQTHTWAGPVQWGDYYKQLQHALGTTQRPQVFARMGYCKKRCAYSPRLLASEVTERI